MKRLLTVIFFTIACIANLYAQNKFAGDEHYREGKYDAAIEEYLLLNETGDFDYTLWYNLGNAYYKNNQLGYAIASYRKAHKLKPSDADVIYNLNIAFNKTKDKIQPAPKNIVVQLTDVIADIFTANAWAVLSVIFAAVAVTIFCVYIFNKKYNYKKYSLVASLLFWFISISFVAMAAHRYYYSLPSMVVIVKEKAIITTSAEKGTDLNTLSEGATLELLETEGNSAKVKLPDGTEGYVSLENIWMI